VAGGIANVMTGAERLGQALSMSSGSGSSGSNVAAPVSGSAGPKTGSAVGPGAGKRSTPNQRQEALAENNGNCVFCNKPANEADHAIPRSRGGDTTTGPGGNLQPTCRHCNRQKGTKTSDEYLEWKQKQGTQQ
jgi:hypothetical protein